MMRRSHPYHADTANGAEHLPEPIHQGSLLTGHSGEPFLLHFASGSIDNLLLPMFAREQARPQQKNGQRILATIG
jgi:hypothetical protein